MRNLISFSQLRHLGILPSLEVFEVDVGEQVPGLVVPELVLLGCPGPPDLDTALLHLGELGDGQTSREENLLEADITRYFTLFRSGVSEILVLKLENPRSNIFLCGEIFVFITLVCSL